jgi:Na+/H+ antiporter NhaA
VAEDTRATPAARGLATAHPHLFYWWAAGDVIFFVVIGAVIMARSTAGGLIVMVIGLLCGVLTALPAIWSERHPEQARAAVAQRKRRQTKLAQQHPAYYLVVVPLFAAVDATLRWNTFHHHRSAQSWALPAIAGLAFGAIVGTILVIKARRARSTSSLHANPSA